MVQIEHGGSGTPSYKPPVNKNAWINVLIGGYSASVISGSYHSGGAGVAGRGGWHTGTDLAVPKGTNVNIPLPGTVVSAGWGAGGGSAFGNAVLVKLKNGDYMYFAHLSSTPLRPGDELKAGAFIGKSGSTGNSTGPHLHVEIRRESSKGRWDRRDAVFYDPVTYLSEAVKGNVDRARATSAVTTSAASGGGGGGTTTTTTSSGGGGGGGVGKVAFSKADFYADLESMFGDLNTLLTIDAAAVKANGGKSIRWAIDEAVRQRLTDPDRFLTLLNQTAWFKQYGSEATKRMIEEKSKPKVFGANRDQVKASIAQHAANLGIKLSDPVLTKLARDAYVYQWDATSATVLDRIQQAAMSGKGTFAGGTIGETLEGMDEYARLFGVQMSQSDVKQLQNDILDGFGDQRMKGTLQARSAQMYSVFAEQIKDGVNVRTLADPYFRAASELLEQSAEEFDMNDPLFTAGRAFQTTDPNTGKIVQRTLADFLTMVRKDVRWEKTDNARKTAMDTTSAVLKQMGLV